VTPQLDGDGIVKNL